MRFMFLLIQGGDIEGSRVKKKRHRRTSQWYPYGNVSLTTNRLLVRHVELRNVSRNAKIKDTHFTRGCRPSPRSRQRAPGCGLF